MPKGSSKKRKPRSEDAAQAAVRIMNTIADRTEADDEPEPIITDEMRAVAAAFGRIGGKIGGRARAQALTAKQRSDIAKRGAEARWGRKK